MSATDGYNDLCGLWQKLDIFHDVDWHCTENHKKYTQMLKERVFDFVHGLNKELDKVRGCVLGVKPFPKIMETFSEELKMSDAWGIGI